MTQLTLLGFAIAVSMVALTAGAVAASDFAPRRTRVVTAVCGLLFALALVLFGLAVLGSYTAA